MLGVLVFSIRDDRHEMHMGKGQMYPNRSDSSPKGNFRAYDVDRWLLYEHTSLIPATSLDLSSERSIYGHKSHLSELSLRASTIEFYEMVQVLKYAHMQRPRYVPTTIAPSPCPPSQVILSCRTLKRSPRPEALVATRLVEDKSNRGVFSSTTSAPPASRDAIAATDKVSGSGVVDSNEEASGEKTLPPLANSSSFSLRSPASPASAIEEDVGVTPANTNAVAIAAAADEDDSNDRGRGDPLSLSAPTISLAPSLSG